MRAVSAWRSRSTFDHPLIGRQSLALDVEPDTFRRELARARTFGFMRDVAKLWSAGYALGASLENTLVVTENRVLNPDGLRYRGRIRPPQGARCRRRSGAGRRAAARRLSLAAAGHKLNHAVLSALMADPSAWTLVEAGRPASDARLCRASRRHGGPGLRAGPVLSLS